jgi:hypothetical protein
MMMMSAKLGVSYFGVRNPEYVEQDLDRIVEAGCNIVLHTFSENDFCYYEETMRDIVRLSKERELEVYIDPWGVGGVFGGEAFTQFALEKDETRQVLSSGDLAPAACPNNKTFRNFMRDWIDAAIYTGADTILWDEPHFYLLEWSRWRKHEGWACRCENCQELFHKKIGYPMPKKFNRDVESFKNESLFNFIKDVTGAAKSRGTNNALCLLPEWENQEKIEQKWDKYARLQALDVFGSDPYYLLAGKEFTDFEYHVKEVKKLADKYHKESQIWIQAFKVKAGDEGELKRSVEAAYHMGIKSIMAWSYLGTACMSSIRSEKPEKVWQTLKKAYLEIRKQ